MGDMYLLLERRFEELQNHFDLWNIRRKNEVLAQNRLKQEAHVAEDDFAL